MALSDDQKAMLRLLAQRDVGLEDIAALKGMSVEEVRAEVNAALGESGKEEGSAQPDPPAPAGERTTPREKPKPAQPREKKPAPAAEAKAPAKPAARRSRPPVPPERRRLLTLAGGALGAIALILIALAVLGGDSDSDSSDAGGSANEQAAAVAEDDKVTQAELQPVDGGDATGRAIFGRVGKDEVVMQVTADGLEATPEGESYTVWLYRSPKLSLRVGSVKVDDAGQLGARFPIPAELLAYIAGGAFDQIYLSRTSDAAYEEEVAQAKQNKSLPSYSGETILRGEITGPIVEASG